MSGRSPIATRSAGTRRNHSPRIGQKPFALFSRGNLLPIPVQQRITQTFLKTPDLLAHSRLGAVNAFARAGKTTGIDDRYEAAEEVEIEHWTPFTISLIMILSFNFQMQRGKPIWVRRREFRPCAPQTLLFRPPGRHWR